MSARLFIIFKYYSWKKKTFLSCIEKKCKAKILLREIDFLFDNSDRDQIVFYNDLSDLKK